MKTYIVIVLFNAEMGQGAPITNTCYFSIEVAPNSDPEVVAQAWIDRLCPALDVIEFEVVDPTDKSIDKQVHYL